MNVSSLTRMLSSLLVFRNVERLRLKGKQLSSVGKAFGNYRRLKSVGKAFDNYRRSKSVGKKSGKIPAHFSSLTVRRRLRFKSIFHLLTVQQHGKGETISHEEAQDPAASIQQQYAECITAGGKRSHHREGMECTVKKQSCTHMELLLPQPGECLGLQHNRHGPTREDGEKQHPTSFQSTLMNHTERHRCCGRAPPLSLESATVA
ncbi:hypothetical protein LR48_Vigan07g208400 [Vigna angularis]|uniref:Uncharacterized protein n=1 Tax=Phaseolus angularis TaxID=3914 RepID=A0A0L9UZU0_PHAAN|nr:hypothetical protein LR48_Vigan07g208400 [Vigna angularis]